MTTLPPEKGSPDIDTVQVHATVRLRNAKMIMARKEAGYSQVLLAEIAGVPCHLIQQLERFDLAAGMVQQREADILALGECLGLTFNDIIPPSLIDQDIVHTFVSVEAIPTQRFLALAAQKSRFILPSPADEAIRHEAAEKHRERLLKCIEELWGVQRYVARVRNGFEGDVLTFRQLGLILRITGGRVQQIHKQAEAKIAEKLLFYEKEDERAVGAVVEARNAWERWEKRQSL